MTREEAIARIKDHIEVHKYDEQNAVKIFEALDMAIKALEQPKIIYCKDCEYGECDEAGWWYCRSLGCQIGNEDGSGYCADAERRTNEDD